MVSLKKASQGAVVVLILMSLFGTAACGGDNDGGTVGDDSSSIPKECRDIAAETESSCAYCEATSCCDVLVKCATLSACSELVSCISDCETESCLTNCEKLYPAGIAPLNAFYECVGNKCKSQCATSA